MGVFAQNTAELAISRREAFHIARLVEPGQIDPPAYAAVFTIDLEPLLEIAANGDLKVKVAQRSVLEFDGDEPAVAPLLDATCTGPKSRSLRPETAPCQPDGCRESRGISTAVGLGSFAARRT